LILAEIKALNWAFILTKLKTMAKLSFKDCTFSDLYLMYVNDFLTIKAMAEYFNEPESTILYCVNIGRKYYNEHLAK
jgi:hypothetical protein